MTTMTVDLTSAEERDGLVDAAQGVDYVVNSAGLIRVKPILDFTVQDIRDIYAVNVEAVWDITSRVGRTVPRGGAIVNLSSASAKLPTNTDIAVYASSKAAVISLTRSFAYAFAPSGVRVNAVCPGILMSPMQDAVISRIAALRGTTVEMVERERVASVPLGRATNPHECAGVIAFLLSDDAAYMTGQAISHDGGMVTG